MTPSPIPTIIDRVAPSREASDTRAMDLLERALVATLALHAIAMVSMALLLLPAMPGGGNADDAVRAARIASHPWLWRLGWLPWQLTAASDVVLGIAFLRVGRVPRLRAWIALLFTCAAVVPDQLAQALWITRGVELASGDLATYLAFERAIFPLTAAWAALLYTLGGVAWCACLSGMRAWSRALARLSPPLYALFALVSVAPLAPLALPSWMVGAGNAIAFVLLEAWLFLALEAVVRLRRPDAPHGRYAPWRAPRSRLLSAIAGSRALRRILEILPVLEFRSDIEDVVYVSYLVPADALAAWVPEGLLLQRLGPKGAWAMFTFLTYRHGHFGPRLAGPLRRLFPSPVQSNWRTYVRDPRTGREGIYFTTNGITTALHAVGGRLMSETPLHLAARGEVTRDARGRMRVVVDPGQGTAPDVEAELVPAAAFALEPPWSECFADARAMLAYAVPQDRAMTTQPWRRATTRAEIELGIPLEACEPLEVVGEVRSAAARAIVGDARPLCFRVARVAFRLRGEQRDRWDDVGASAAT